MVVPFCKERPKGENRSPYNPTKPSHTPYTASFLRILYKTGAQKAGYLWSFAVCTVKKSRQRRHKGIVIAHNFLQQIHKRTIPSNILSISLVLFLVISIIYIAPRAPLEVSQAFWSSTDEIPDTDTKEMPIFLQCGLDSDTCLGRVLAGRHGVSEPENPC